MEEGKPYYEVWMQTLSDEIISTATAYGNRFFLQQALEFMNVECVHPGALQIMERVTYMFMINEVKNSLGWYLQRGFISREAAKNLEESY